MASAQADASTQRNYHNENRQSNHLGAIWVLCSGICAIFMVTLVKVVANHLDLFQIIFFRSFIAFLFIAPVIVRAGIKKTCTSVSYSLHILRAFMGYAALAGFFFAAAHAPLANVTAIGFTKTLFIVVLAALILRERVGWYRGMATVCGFIGVLIIVRPGAAGFDANLLPALGAALMAALSGITLKVLSGRDSTLTILVLFNLLIAGLSVIPAIIYWNWPTPMEWLVLVAIGLCGVGVQFCLVRGLRQGEAAAVMPFDYFRLPFAGLLGFLVFGTVPDPWAIVGALVIVVSTVYIAVWSSRREGPAAKPPGSGVAEREASLG